MTKHNVYIYNHSYGGKKNCKKVCKRCQNEVYMHFDEEESRSLTVGNFVFDSVCPNCETEIEHNDGTKVIV